MRAQPLLSETLSEGDRHRQKRANVQAGQLQQKMSTLMGRPLGEAELRTIFPSFSAQMPGSAFSGEGPLQHRSRHWVELWATLHISSGCVQAFSTCSHVLSLPSGKGCWLV